LNLNDLRGLYIFLDENNKLYLLYVGGGEKAIDIAELIQDQENE